MPTRPPRRIAALALFAALAAQPAAADPPIVPPVAPPAQGFGDWQLECAAECRLQTILRSTQPGAPELMRVGLAPDPSGSWMLSIRTPLGLYLPDPLTLTPDETEPRSVPWLTCTATGCIARTLLDPDILEALRRQRRASIAFTLVDGTHVRLPLSLGGVSAGLAALQAQPRPRSLRP